jgi:acyl carrier protein
MDDISILAKLTSMLRTVFNDNSLTATPELTASDVRDWDSLGQIRLFFEIERVFSVRFSPPEVSSAKSIGQIVELIKIKTAGL